MVTYIYAISKVIGENKHMDQEATPLLIERKNIQPVLTASRWLFFLSYMQLWSSVSGLYMDPGKTDYSSGESQEKLVPLESVLHQKELGIRRQMVQVPHFLDGTIQSHKL